MSRWTWAADVALAVVLAAATWYTAVNPALPEQVVFPGVVPGPDGAPPGPPVPPAFPGGDAEASGLWATGDAPLLLLVLAAICTLPIAVRRRFPLGTWWSVLTLTVTFHLLYDTGISPDATTVFTFAAVLLAGVGAVLYSPYRTAALVGLGIGAVVLAALYETNVPVIGPGYVPLFVLLAIALAFNAIHGWKQQLRTARAEQRAAQVRAVQAERARIARELHDVVTHHVSVMVVQAGAARTVLDSAPERAREALLGVEASGREAMTELRDVMGLLTTTGDDGADTGGDDGADTGGDDGADTGGADAPQPGLADLPAMIDRMRSSGADVRLTVHGRPCGLSAGADLAAYRVVQEALTNALKHAGGAAIDVTVHHDEREVRIEVTDSGGEPTAAARDGGGRGLVGLRERLALYGGNLRAQPLPAAGFRVIARIPTGRPAGAAP